MWRAEFNYSDNSKATIRGKGAITFEIALKVWLAYGAHAEKSSYQKYPKKDNTTVCFEKELKDIWDKEVAGMEYEEFIKKSNEISHCNRTGA